MRPTGSQEAYMPSWTKKKGIRVWDLKGEEEHLQEDGKTQNVWYKQLRRKKHSQQG